ncbi:hypothetical protein VOLCADRAFT_97493 [Volvox carteri f. nagariensis]|uniref:Carboxylesterase type B domain-containing protein n=1 Tax=Volvox carteri f. nagariensis TaxID=3068 RepID=D8UCW2_VOLCA|nr:uncharacterized protein VOLCADRAFT_97493 [Volvox carteri f. nagariensis]EFJ42411.1 hypothetical protein VOLCADRAFT_97493 [Volvox carteri f. nagariensis]|eukprot:XP_002956474.1 hypothetical protein VOLCADRAFT_97493 [Volvox carteri f. nagariensis]
MAMFALPSRQSFSVCGSGQRLRPLSRGCRFCARAGAVIDKQGQAFTRHVVVQVLKWLSDHAAACGANDTPWEQQTNVGDSGAPTAAAAAASAAQRQLLWEVLRLLVKHSEAGKTKQARGWLMGQSKEDQSVESDLLKLLLERRNAPDAHSLRRMAEEAKLADNPIVKNAERLVRRVLELPNRPAVVLVHSPVCGMANYPIGHPKNPERTPYSDYWLVLWRGVHQLHECVKLLCNATKVPVLLGVNANEGALEVLGQTRGLDPIDVEGFFTVVNSLIPISPSFNERLYQQYNTDEYYGGSWLLSAINVITDGGYHCPSRRVVKLLSAQGLTVRYHILQTSKPKTGCPLFVTTGLFFGEEFTNFMDAFHSYDIPFTFLAPYRYPFNQCPFTPNETQLASYLSGIINAVAASGSPLPPRTSSLTSRLLKNTPSWKPWTATSNPVMNIDTAGPRVFEAADLLLDAKCQFWDDLLNADITASTAFHS